MEFRKTANSVYKLKYHVVWVCKYRRRILNPGVVEYLKRIFPKLLKSMPGVEIEQVGPDKDHIHFVMIIPPKYSIAHVMGGLKGQSASLIRKKFIHLEKVYWKENVLWSPGYFVSSVGADERVIKNYVEYQGQQDLGQLRLEL